MKIVVIGPQAGALITFRGDMLSELAAAGHSVLALAPDEDVAVRDGLAAMGVRFGTIPMARTGLNPLRDANTVLHLTRVLTHEPVDIVLAYAAKPVIYGLIAARLARVPFRAAMITGLGSALGGGPGARRRTLRALMRFLYRLAMRQAQLVFFQNPDNERLFRELSIVDKRHRVVRINGSGVNLERFSPELFPPEPVTFLFVGRLIRDKGIEEYVNAARAVRIDRPGARFQVLGPLDSNPTAISSSQLNQWRREGVIEYLGSADDVRPFLANAHVLVLPSYGEGMPRSVLEAMAMARPILTTDAPGCRETVESGRNGYLVPASDWRALAERMVALVDESDSLEQMGRESRAIAEERFDVHEVNRAIINALGITQGT